MVSGLGKSSKLSYLEKFLRQKVCDLENSREYEWKNELKLLEISEALKTERMFSNPPLTS